MAGDLLAVWHNVPPPAPFRVNKLLMTDSTISDPGEIPDFDFLFKQSKNLYSDKKE